MPRGEIEMDSNDLSLSVTGMTCAACVSSVERVLSNIDFVYTKKSKNIKMLSDLKYFKFKFSVAGLKL